MKILIIQVGNTVQKEALKSDKNYFHYDSLIEGKVYFDEKQIINNVQTREGLSELGYEVDFYFHTKRKKFRDLIKSSMAIRGLVKKHKPDVTHIYWGGVSGFLAQSFCPGRTIVSLLGSDLHGSYHMDGRKILSSRLQTLCSRLIGLLSTRTIVMSQRMKDYLWNSKSERINAIPEGLLLSKFSPGNKNQARKALGWKDDTFVVIFFYEGQAVKNKALANSSFSIFKARNPNSCLKIIRGYNHNDLVHVYRGADCMLITSFHEGSNNSVKEAMACDLPIVSVNCGDAEERLGPLSNSFVVNYDPKKIAEQIEVICKNGKRSNGSAFIKEVSIPAISKRVGELYHEMLI
jgi:teichuronic acid biosynthesis glycosyltransferase TuaC